MTCKDKDDIFTLIGAENGRCALPSTGTLALVRDPTDPIFEKYKVDCNDAYYAYNEYTDCDNTLAESFKPIHIFDAASEKRVLDMNKSYMGLAKKAARDRGVSESASAYKEYVKLLEARHEDLEERLVVKREAMPTQCTASANWLAGSGGRNANLVLKADSCFTLVYSGLLTHAQFTKCMKYSGDEDPFEQQAFALFYKPNFASVAEADIKTEFEEFM